MREESTVLPFKSQAWAGLVLVLLMDLCVDPHKPLHTLWWFIMQIPQMWKLMKQALHGNTSQKSVHTIMLFLHCQVMVGNIFFVQGDLGTKICTSWFLLMVKINIFIASLRGIGLTHTQIGHLTMSRLLSLLTEVTHMN